MNTKVSERWAIGVGLVVPAMILGSIFCDFENRQVPKTSVQKIEDNSSPHKGENLNKSQNETNTVKNEATRGRSPEEAKKFIETIQFSSSNTEAATISKKYSMEISEIIERNFSTAEKAKVFSFKWEGEPINVEIEVVVSPISINKLVEEMAFASKEIANSTEYKGITWNVLASDGYDPQTGKQIDVFILGGIIKSDVIRELELDYFKKISPRSHKTFVEAYRLSMRPELREQLW